MTRQQRVEEENRRIRKLRRIVDLTSALLYQLPLTLESAQGIIDAARQSVLTLFPDCEGQFNLIHMSRFYRILRERKILPES